MHPYLYSQRLAPRSPGEPTGSAPAAPAAPISPSPEAPPAGDPPPADPPAGDPPAEDPPAADPPAPDAAAEALATARAVKPEKADGYALNVSEAAQKVLGDLTGDPAVTALREGALAKGWTQGEFDDRIGQAVDLLAEKGLLQPSFDPAAELAKLGENGEARRQEVETFANSLKERKELTDDEYGELMSLAPTAAGVTLFEKLKKMMTPGSHTPLPGATDTPAGGNPGDTADQAEARVMQRDPKYETDRAFKREADKKWMAAFSTKG